MRFIPRTKILFQHFWSLLLIVTLLVIGLSCTKNPFTTSEPISSRTIRGKVLLSDGANPEGALVWLETYDVVTRTDEKGKFILSLPSGGGGGSSSELNGIFHLYFYVANYQLDSSEVVVVNGEVARGEGDIDENGYLIETKILTKLLTIKTEVLPLIFRRDYKGTLSVTITLQALSGSVTVESLIKVEEHKLLRSGLFVVNEQDSIVSTFGTESEWNHGAEMISAQSKKWNISLFWPTCDLPAGTYKIIPYLLVRQANLPSEMMDNIGPDVESFGPEYLRLPFVREGGDFIIFDPASP